jgi:isoleucyl-tRNA synthetase
VLSEGLPIVEADYVTADSGTGLVHSAPAHGMEDYVTWKAQDSMTGSLSSPIASFVDADGQYSAALSSTILEPDVDHLIGASVLEDAPQKIMADLQSRGYLLGRTTIRHKYPYDWRTKKPVIIRSTPQWFADVEDIKSQALEALQAVNFVPEQGLCRFICSESPR